jgi:hypothetical protein
MRPLKARMIGTWTLLSWTRLVSGVKELGPFGTDALGQISYSPDGYMSAHLMGRNRAKFETDDAMGSSNPQERAAAYDGYLGYCGRYEIDEHECLVLHRIAISSNPNWTKTVQKRLVQFIGERMELTTTPFLTQGKEATVTLLWERAK